jgi:hypothetical protein
MAHPHFGIRSTDTRFTSPYSCSTIIFKSIPNWALCIGGAPSNLLLEIGFWHYHPAASSRMFYSSGTSFYGLFVHVHPAALLTWTRPIVLGMIILFLPLTTSWALPMPRPIPKPANPRYFEISALYSPALRSCSDATLSRPFHRKQS